MEEDMKDTSPIDRSTICTSKEYEKFKSGSLLYDTMKRELVPADPEHISNGNYKTYEEIGEYIEIHAKGREFPWSDELIAFEYYGHEG